MDAGAEAALFRGKSLLPAGVTAVEGAFDRGDPVELAGQGDTVVAVALAGYDAEEIEKSSWVTTRPRSGSCLGIRAGPPSRIAMTW